VYLILNKNKKICQVLTEGKLYYFFGAKLECFAKLAQEADVLVSLAGSAFSETNRPSYKNAFLQVVYQ
jgi:cytoplasmic iron level regulating protein YaaA (DUF328/UPF0246 family)